MRRRHIRANPVGKLKAKKAPKKRRVRRKAKAIIPAGFSREARKAAATARRKKRKAAPAPRRRHIAPAALRQPPGRRYIVEAYRGSNMSFQYFCTPSHGERLTLCHSRDLATKMGKPAADAKAKELRTALRNYNFDWVRVVPA